MAYAGVHGLRKGDPGQAGTRDDYRPDLAGGKVTHVPDVHADPDYAFSEAQRLSGDPRTFLGRTAFARRQTGCALVLLRKTMRPFTDQAD